MQYAKEIGCRDYNFGGVTTPENPQPEWEGLTLFKQKFGGRTVVHSDFYDVVAQPLWYWAYVVRKWIQEKIRR